MSIYQKFCHEELDEQGRVKSFRLDYPENFNFGYDVVDAIAEKTPDKRALVWCNTENEERVFTFGDISRLSNKCANVFRQAGLKKGDKVMLILKRHYEYWIAAVALHKLGVIMIPATHLLTVHDLVYRFSSAKVNGIVCTGQNDVPSKIKMAVAETGLDCKLWCVHSGNDGFEDLGELMEKADDKLERVETKNTDHMLMYFTSGTTGYPKGVIHDYAYPLGHIATAKYWQQAQDGGLHFTIAETGWAKASWGKIYGQWLVESAVMVYDFDNFDPKNIAKIINKYKVTSFCAPPTFYRYLAKKGISDMPALKHASTAGEWLAPEIWKEFTDVTGIPLCEGFGQTETTMLTGNLVGYEPVAGSMGMASPLYNLDLRDSDNNPVAVGEIGELVVIPPKNGRQEGIFCAYLDNDEQYKEVWRGGVYHTGDAAWKDENGYFWFNGRFDDIIKTGGFRVGPAEIEGVIHEHPAVMECSVIGIPDALRGQAIKAYIVLGSGYEPSKQLEQEIKMFCNSKMADYKWIRFIEFADELPKTISGKVKKTELRKQSEKKQ